MPSNSNSIGSLQLPQLDLPTLNNRMRRIGVALQQVGLLDSSSGGSGSGSGSAALTLSLPGVLTIASDVMPAYQLPSARTFTKALVLLKQAPIGGAVTVQLYWNGAAWASPITLTGLSTKVDVSSLGQVAASSPLRVDITGTPTGGSNFPGSDLTVQLF